MSGEILGPLLAAFLAYPVIAGMAYRRLRPYVPPEPHRCGGEAKSSRYRNCDGAKDRMPYISVNYPSLYCDDCNAWLKWATAHRPSDTTARVTAILWPLAPFYYLPKRLFAIGAGVRILSAHPERAEDSEAGAASGERQP